jgi:hypothetical protein
LLAVLVPSPLLVFFLPFSVSSLFLEAEAIAFFFLFLIFIVTCKKRRPKLPPEQQQQQQSSQFFCGFFFLCFFSPSIGAGKDSGRRTIFYDFSSSPYGERRRSSIED